MGVQETRKKSRVNRGKVAKKSTDPSVGNSSESNDNEDYLCVICTNKILYAAISPCHHITCHKCTFRQRALYKKNNCLVCRHDNDKVIFSKELVKDYDDFKGDYSLNTEFGIYFTDKEVEREVLALLENRCKVCQREFAKFKDLTDHVKKDHNKFFCLICAKNQKSFVPELTLYSYKPLQKHLSEGDVPGFLGHPECKYCKKRFYSEDELNIHIRDRHERCYICDQYTPQKADYYRDYDSLYEHFKRAHYVCLVPVCVERRFVVFREDLDLTAHMLKEHGGLNGGRFTVGLSESMQSQLRNTGSSSEESVSNDEKKMRFEERAKHYLNYDREKLKQFLEINGQYRQKKVTAKALLTSYQNLFEHQSSSELSLLIYEFSELFPDYTELHKDLHNLWTSLNGVSREEQFPVLAGSNVSSAANLHSWGKRSTINSGVNSSNEDFPVLSKPSRTSSPLPKNNFKYNLKTTKPETKTLQAPANYKHNYLDGLNGRSSLTLSGGSSARSSPSSSDSNLPPLSNANFPKLQKEKTKKPIPRVRQFDIPDPNLWGKEPEEPTPIQEPETEPTDKRTKKLKKKQQNLLFSM